MHLLSAFKVILNVMRSGTINQNIISEDIISYNDEKILQDLDLVYKKYLMDEIDSIRNMGLKSVFKISGLTVIDWSSISLDEDGNPNENDITYVDAFGDYPSNIYCMLSDGTKEVKLDLPISRLPNGNFEIDATGLNDVVVVIS